MVSTSPAVDPAPPPQARAALVLADFTGRQVAILSLIAAHDGLSNIDIARTLGLLEEVATRGMDRLVAEGLATRVKDKNDRRKVRCAATEAGRALLARAQAEARADA